MSIMSILFFSIPPLNKNNQKAIFTEANKEKIRKAAEDVFKNKGSKSFSKIINLVDILANSESNYKLGGGYLTVAAALVNSLVNSDNKPIPVVHHNEIEKIDDITISKTHVTIGRNHNRKLKSYLSGPVYDKFKKVLIDTRQDYLNTAFKKELYSKAGINQRNFTFLDQDCFLSIENIMELTEYKEKHEKTLTKLYKEFLDKKIKEKDKEDIIPNTIKEIINRRNNKQTKMIRHYSGLLSQKTQLKIYNKMPGYKAHLRVYLVKFNNLQNDITTIDQLIQEISWKSETKNKKEKWVERLTEDKIKKKLKSKGKSNFSQQLHTTLDTNIVDLEAFKNKCVVIKNWTRTIKSGSAWELNVTEKFSDGIYLNKLHELVDRKIKLNTPISHFFIIESFGDRRASIIRNSDGESFQGIYSPVKLAYDFKLEIEHLSKAVEQDEIVSYQKTTKSKEFDEESLGLQFYPNREEYLNVDYDKICIGDGENKNATFKLNFSSSILENQESSNLEKLINKIAKIDKEEAETISEDDIPFLNTTKGNLRGNEDNNETPYDEYDHH